MSGRKPQGGDDQRCADHFVHCYELALAVARHLKALDLPRGRKEVPGIVTIALTTTGGVSWG
jgi:hypothetical protein